jgi:hypothetical protein
MDEDTKLVLEAWRVLLWENDMLRRRVVELEQEVCDVTKHIDVGNGSVFGGRVDRSHRGDADNSD